MVHKASHWLYQDMSLPREAISGSLLQRWYWDIGAYSSRYEAEKRESIKTFVERFQSMTLLCLNGMTQSMLVETCCHNLQTTLLAQIGVAEYRTWK